MTPDDPVTEDGRVTDAHPATEDAALTARLRKALDDAGFAHRLADVSVAGELAAILEDLAGSGQVAESLLAEYAESLAFSCPEDVGEPRALVVVASPSPAVQVRFQLESGPFEAMIPPTYVSTDAKERALEAMRSVLGPAGFTGGAGPDTGQAPSRPHRSGSVWPQQRRLRPEPGVIRAPGRLLHRRAAATSRITGARGAGA